MSKNISIFDHCFGCGVCAFACPKKAIALKQNLDGFYQPVVNGAICVSCGICLNVCAFNHNEVCQTPFEPVSTAAWSNDKETRFNCTSGGTAFEIEKALLNEGYSICGVNYDIEQKKAFHYIAETESELRKSIGSKYIQSYTVSAFSSFEKSKKYLVVGTPCQIDSLRRWLKKSKREEDFILMDFFCHSVPSRNMWLKYLDYVGIRNPEIVQFRNKRNSWQDSTTVCIQGDGKEWFSSLSKGDLFYAFFLGDRCPNPCCVKECKYKREKSAADLRIGDLWGYKYIDNKDGVNALVAFTSKGTDVIEKIKKSCTLEPCDFATVSELQMKNNCRPTRSYQYVMKSLQGDKPIDSIFNTARLIELPDSYPLEIKQLAKRILKLIKLIK